MLINFWNWSCFFLIAGVLMAVAGVCMKYYGEQIEPLKGRAEARVVDIITIPRTGDSTFSEFRNRQAAVFEFYAGGKLIKVTDPADTYPCHYQMHQKVNICYEPADPFDFHVMEKNRWIHIGRWLYISGMLFICFGCACFLMHASRIEL